MVREFDAKLLFACVAAERGYAAIVGSKFEMHRRMGDWPTACYIHKDVHSWPRLLQRLRRLGHRVLAWDEEGLVNVSPERYVQMRVSADVLGTAEALFAWGRENADAWTRSGLHRDTPIHITGNPRGDLMRPELRGYFDSEVADLHRRFGTFVLVNTNFGFVNHIRTKSQRDLAGWRHRAGQQDGFMEGFVAFRREIFEHFQTMIPYLADSFPDVTLIVRPHPVEDADVWHRTAGGRRNVQVLREGNATPWLLAAAATVHNGCSTGLEAYLLGRPAIAYRPARSERYDIPLPNAVSHEASDLEALKDLVGQALGGRLATPANEVERRSRLIDQNIAAMHQALASDRIIDVLSTMEIDRRPSIVQRQKQRLLRLTGRLTGRRGDSDLELAIKDHKFPLTPVSVVESKIAAFARVLGRFQNIGARELAPRIFEVARL